MTPAGQSTYLEALHRLLRGETVDSSGRPHPLGDPITAVHLEVVDDGPYPELLIRFELVVDDRHPWPPSMQGPLEARAPFEPEWLHLTGLDDLPGLYFGGALTRAVEDVVRLRYEAAVHPERPSPDEVVAAAPAAEDLWGLLLGRLAEEGEVTEVSPGELRVARAQEDYLTVLVTPEQWRHTWALHVRPAEEQLARRLEQDDGRGIDDGPYDDGTDIGEADPFLVHFQGRLRASVRAALPPVDAELTRIVATRRAGGSFGWYARTPRQ